MSDHDFLLFIDANKYLDLYRTNKGKKLLALLREQVNYIFVTQQVVNEVQRNRIDVAANFLSEASKKLESGTCNLPDHLFGKDIEKRKAIAKQMKEAHKNTNQINDEIKALLFNSMEQINSSEDEVSKVLSPIFANAVSHSPEELQRARDRRELGNPPGKTKDPLGDQLNWEQILTYFKGKRRLWIISSDGDYGTFYVKKHSFLNSFLYNELCKISSKPEVYLFDTTAEGISHFIETTGVKAKNRLKSEEIEEIRKEERSLVWSEQLKEILRSDESSILGVLGNPKVKVLLESEEFRKELGKVSTPFDNLNSEQKLALEESAGAWLLENHPELKDEKGIEKLLRESRKNWR